jgi:predicted ATPase/DNA-binding SARP family transcriptional activator
VSREVEIRLLGPLEVEVAGERVGLEGARQRRLLTALALRAPEAVPLDELVELLWGDAAPAGAVGALQRQVSRLRGRLGERVAVRRDPAGYVLEVDRGALDTRRFEELVGRARVALAAGDPARAAGDLRAALGLWRGPALAEHRFEEFAQGEIARLEALRVEAIEERLAAELAGGADAELVGELQALVAEHPLRERLRGQLMLALYRAGRQADALEVMRAGRRLLLDELGIEPGPELRRLERMILAHDPALTAERPAVVLAAPLPAPASETIGREGELAEIGALLGRPEVRLVTLVGTGGVGKTRLALEAGRALAGQFPGGAVHVNLDGVRDGGVLVPAAAAALGVVAATAAELGERLARTTRGAPALLVLDGFERFVEDAGRVAELLAAAGNLKVLATSRAALRLTIEHTYRVQPLAAPNAAALLRSRVRAARPEWTPADDEAVVRAICARLDGLPLAIELAADRARLLSLPALLERLQDRLELLTGGPRDLPARQRSLRATLEWSWEVLQPAERALLARLTVFEGSVSLAAAQAVCDPDGETGVEALIGSVLDKTSLLRTDSGSDAQPRVEMLDTVREFAAEHAAAGEDLPALERRHERYFLQCCEHAADQAERAQRREWQERLARERGNIRAAFERLLRAGAAEDALRIAIAFARTLPWDAHAHEVRGWLGQSLAALPHRSARTASGHYWDGRLALSQARLADARAPLQAALEDARELGDRPLEAAALSALGRRAVLIADPGAAELCQAAVAAARATAAPGPLADALLALAGACERTRAWEQAGALAADALALYRTAGDPYGAATALAELGWYDLVHGRLDDAERHLGQALELRRRHGDDRRLVEPLIDHAWLMLAREPGGEPARQAFLDCLALARHVDDQFNIGEALAGLCTHAAQQTRWDDAALLAGASAAAHERIGAPPWESVSAIQDRALAPARRALGAERYARLFAEGRGLAPADALAHAAPAIARLPR